MTFEAIKANKRLWIREVETGKLVYTPPDHMRSRIQSRQPMIDLAEAMTRIGKYDIRHVIDFEVRYGKDVRCPPPCGVD